MKKVVLLVLFILSVPLGSIFAWEDNTSGDYLLASSHKVISMDLENANLVDVVKMLSQQTGINFVSTEAVRERKLTLYLENTPLKESIDIIFKANNLTYDYYPDANLFVIKEMGKPSVELRTKVYTLKYARVGYSRLEKEITNRMEPASTTQATAGTQAQAGSPTGSSSDAEKKEERGIRGAIKRMLTEFGKISEDPLTNSIIVTDVPSQFPMIDEVVNKLDIAVPIVMIETEMLDVSKNTIDSMGVNWPEALITLGVTGTKLTTFPMGKLFHRNNMPMAGNTIDYAEGVFGEAGQIINGLEFLNFPANKFTPSVLTVIGADLVLNFLKSATDTKSLARPKIMTLANETAEIKIVTDEAVGVKRTDSDSGGGSTTFDIERAETGTRLRVTPQVDLDSGEITLFVETIVKEAVDSGFTSSTTNLIAGTIKDPEERSATAIARLKNGETLLMAGLIRNAGSTQQTKIPFLGDIPFIGNAFRWKYTDKTERELLVFLTPSLVGQRPVLAGREALAQREQASFKRESMKIALDRYSR